MQGKILSLEEEILSLKKKMEAYNDCWVPPGTYYSPVPSSRFVKLHEDRIYQEISQESLPGIDLNQKGQLDLLENFKDFYSEMPFTPNKSEGLRYYF